ncbi:MAG: HNH endonuclease [bacterium]|nr:HNH endonuclease [bacterium]
MSKVNLDALIPREDFEIKIDSDASSVKTQTLQIRDLEPDQMFYNVLRKPDFQRETGDWDEKKIFSFIESFVEGDLIPAIILWDSGNYVFVVDGSHRLSSLIAWVTDDYGDGMNSRAYFKHNIPEDQIKIAEKARRLINGNIGLYKDFKLALVNPDKSDEALLSRARRLAALAIQLQWVKGDANKAEASFFKINLEATPINKTELKLLEARNKPTAIAARAIIRSGTGHKYWSKFPDEIQDAIEKIAKEINELLFAPAIKTPIKTLDLPVAGKGYSAKTLTLIFDLVNFANKTKEEKEITDDPDGSETINYLKKVRKLIYRMTGNHPSSLGLHPAVYFYSIDGRYQPTAFLAIIELLKEFEDSNYFNNFTKVRGQFEAFLVKRKGFMKDVHYKFGSGVKGYKQLLDLYRYILENIEKGMDGDELAENMVKEPRFKYITPSNINIGGKAGGDFSQNVKSAAFLRDALNSALRCKICGGHIHLKSISIDHKKRKSEGGTGDLDNAQLTHPYCNTTFKN